MPGLRGVRRHALPFALFWCRPTGLFWGAVLWLRVFFLALAPVTGEPLWYAVTLFALALAAWTGESVMLYRKAHRE